MTKTLCFLLIVCFFYACESNTLTAEDTDETKTFITHDTILDTRDSVNKKPIASYTSAKGSPLQVDVYETKQMFRFIMMMQYQFLNEPDTLRIPNFGIRPKIVVKPGDDKQSCIVGFLDTKGKFKEYKMVTVKSGNLQVKVLKRYFAGHYKTVFTDPAKLK